MVGVTVDSGVASTTGKVPTLLSDQELASGINIAFGLSGLKTI